MIRWIEWCRANASRSRVGAVLLLSAWIWTAPGPAAGEPVAVVSDWGVVRIAGREIVPGQRSKFTYLGAQTFEGGFVDFRVYVARGLAPGPTLCVTSAIHGDEINSIEIARRSFERADPERLAGTLIVLPAINATGFRTLDRYMPDRRDLNRFFPGSRSGSIAGIVAYEVFSGIVRHCDRLVDLHTGSSLRSNMPQIRVDTRDERALALARSFGSAVIIDGAGPRGSLRREAMQAGIPAIIYEAGPPLVFVEADIEQGVRGVAGVMADLGMTGVPGRRRAARRVARSAWLRAPLGQAGIYLPTVELGARVEAGQLLATITDPVSDVVHPIRAKESGIVIGMALPQIVLSGYGLFHVGTFERD